MHLGCALLLSCQDPGPNQSSSQTTEIDTLRLERELIIGEDAGVVIGRIDDLAVDSKGQIYVSDPTLNAIQVFSPSGTPEATIGREGKGPGEFEHLDFIAIGKNDTLYAFDGPE